MNLQQLFHATIKPMNTVRERCDVQQGPRASQSVPTSRPASPVGGKTEEGCCGTSSHSLAVLIGNIRQDIDQTQLKADLIQLLQRRMVQVLYCIVFHHKTRTSMLI